MTTRYRRPEGVAGDCPPEAAARVMFMTLEAFQEKLPELLGRGFPPADATTGNFDMDAINRWRQLRHEQVSAATPLTPPQTARHAGDVVRDRLRRLDG